MPLTKQQLISQGYEEDPLYRDLWWEPVDLGRGRVSRPEWMRQRDLCLGTNGVKKREDYLGQAHHFRKFCDCFFSDPGGLFHMEWNPNAVKITDRFFACNFLSVMGAKSESKSYTLACIAVGMFLLNPAETKVLVTSTTMDSARGKIWGDISYAADQAKRAYESWGLPPPFRKMGSPVIRYEMGGVESYKSGVELIPTQSSSEKQSVDKVQGYKQSTVIFLGDEWDTLPQGLVNTVNDNLSGNPSSRCIAAFNPTGRFTPGGRIAKPRAGWASIDMDSTEWEGEFGPVIRFDATRSPNIVGPLRPDGNFWNGLMTPTRLELELAKYGSSQSSGFFTFIRGFFPPIGELECIYSDAEITQYLADHPVRVWLDRRVKIMGVDPSFVHGGDNAMMVIAQVGTSSVNQEARKVFERIRTVNLDDHITDKTVSKDEQVVRLIAKFAREEGIAVENIGVDITGAPSFSSLLNREIGTGWLGVNSSARPTELPVSKSDSRKCCDVFDSLMSELWYVGKPLMREGQIKGLDPDTVEEMCKRTYKGRGLKDDRVIVESKRSMKKRTGSSPDRSDAYFIALLVARKRHFLASGERVKGKAAPQVQNDPRAFLRPTWGEKKKPQMGEQMVIDQTMGGGWGYDQGGSGWPPMR